MPGNDDLRALAPDDYQGLLDLRQPLEELIDTIFEQCAGSCMMILSHAPPRTNVFDWPPSPQLKQVVQWNSILSEMVNKKATLNEYKIMAMHPPVSAHDIFEDNGWPTNYGYQKIAYEFAERLFVAKRLDWIPAPVDFDDPTPGTADPEPGQCPVSSAKWNHCSAFRGDRR